MSASLSGVTMRVGGRTAVEGVSLEAVSGEVRCVLGGDGAGKSTLLRVLCGAVDPHEGHVRRPPRRMIGYLPPGSGVYGDLTVDENLHFYASAYALGSLDARRRIDDLLDAAGLAAARRRLVSELSGGMRQKLGVICALLHRPTLLVLDEPTTGVDPVSRAELWRLVARSAATGAAVVLATTYVEEAERATWVLVLSGGRPLVAGTPQDVVARVPGTLRASDQRPGGVAAAWRRGRAWRSWSPDPAAALTGEPVPADLRDALVVAELVEELTDAPGRGVP